MNSSIGCLAERPKYYIPRSLFQTKTVLNTMNGIASCDVSISICWHGSHIIYLCVFNTHTYTVPRQSVENQPSSFWLTHIQRYTRSCVLGQQVFGPTACIPGCLDHSTDLSLLLIAGGIFDLCTMSYLTLITSDQIHFILFWFAFLENLFINFIMLYES